MKYCFFHKIPKINSVSYNKISLKSWEQSEHTTRKWKNNMQQISKNMCMIFILKHFPFLFKWLHCMIKFMIFKKATKNDEIFTVNLTLCYSKCQIDDEYFINFCGLLRKHELYIIARSGHVCRSITLTFTIIGRFFFKLLWLSRNI